MKQCERRTANPVAVLDMPIRISFLHGLTEGIAKERKATMKGRVPHNCIEQGPNFVTYCHVSHFAR